MPTNLKHKILCVKHYALKILCTDSQMEVPTWAAYNSVIVNVNSLTLVSTLPIINDSSTE